MAGKQLGFSSATVHEPVARLFNDYYGIDFYSLYKRSGKNGRPVVHCIGVLFSGDDFSIEFSEELKLYLKNIQSEYHFP